MSSMTTEMAKQVNALYDNKEIPKEFLDVMTIMSNTIRNLENQISDLQKVNKV